MPFTILVALSLAFEVAKCALQRFDNQPSISCAIGTATLCIDYLNGCGVMYGGCYDICSSPTPTYTAPECPSAPAKMRLRVGLFDKTTITADGAAVTAFLNKYHLFAASPALSKAPALVIPASKLFPIMPLAPIVSAAAPVVSAAPAVVSSVVSQLACGVSTVCLDAGKCGRKYGGCFDLCNGPPDLERLVPNCFEPLDLSGLPAGADMGEGVMRE